MKQILPKLKLISALVLGVVLCAPVSQVTYAATITQLNVPSSADARVVASSEDGHYIAYMAEEHSPNSGRILHRFDTTTEADIPIAEISNGLADMTSDGGEIVFSSWGDPNFTAPSIAPGKVYVWDAADGSYEQVSPDTPSGDYAVFPSISDDGQYVAWTGSQGTFVLNRATNSTTRIDDFQGTSPPVLSGDGGKVVVTGWSNELNQQITGVYATSSGNRLSYLSGGQFSITSLSSDGNYASGYAYATNQGDGITWFDFTTGGYSVIANTADYQCVGDSLISYAAISSDGQAVAFASLSTALAPENTGSPLGYYTYYPATGAIVNESGDTTNNGVSSCPSTAVSGDGTNIFYTSDAADNSQSTETASRVAPMSFGAQSTDSVDSEPRTNIYKAAIKQPKTQQTHTDLRVTPQPVVPNEEVALTATVSRDKHKANMLGNYKGGGWVTFSINGEVVAKAELDSAGVATTKIIVPDYGHSTQKYTAFFAGNEKFSSSWVSQVVQVKQ